MAKQLLDWRRRALLCGTAVVAGIALASYGKLAAAQTQGDDQADATEGEEIEQIVVTGSRIRRLDFVSNSPVLTVSGDQVWLQGAINVEEFLNELPQLIPGLNQTSNNPGLGGIAALDLRGLGANRTLILVNGHRITPATNGGIYDVNFIPAGLIERTEVVTGGASAVYGSDAIAGVVNFILKRDFEGFEAGSQYEVNEAEGHQVFSANLLLGGNFADGRGNATLFGEYLTRDQLLQGELPFGFDQGPFARSSRIPQGRLSGQAANPYDLVAWNAATRNNTFCAVDANGDGLCDDANGDGMVDADDFTISPSQNLQFNPDGTLAGPAGLYNYAPPNAAILPMTRFITRAEVRYELFDGHEFSSNVTFANINTRQQLAPTPADIVLDPQQFRNNPLIDPDVIALLDSRVDPNAPFEVRRRMVEVGNRISNVDRKYFEWGWGMQGPLPGLEGFNYDVYAKFGRVDENTRNLNNVSRSRTIAALEGCPPGAPVGCIPATIFGEGSLTPEMADYLRLNTDEDLKFKQETVTANIDGPLFELPAGEMRVAVGYEFRRDASVFQVADAEEKGDIIGFNAIRGISGHIRVHEFYGEGVVPIVKDLFLVENLEVEGGYRLSDYSTIGTVSTYKIGGSWTPHNMIRLRAMFNKATRSPNIFELFQAGDENFPQFSDPCNASSSPSPEVKAFCIAQGVPAAAIDTFQQNDTQVRALEFGNLDLRQEKAKTITAGAVVTPDEFIPGLTLTVDFYRIRLIGAISDLTVGQILNACFQALDLNDPNCQRITRDPTTGQILTINTTRANVSSIQTRGYDFTLSYQVDFDDTPLKMIPGSFRMKHVASYVTQYLFDGVDILGRSGGGAGGALPKWRVTLEFTYDPIPGLSIDWQSQRIGSSSQPFSEIGNLGPGFDFTKPLPVVWYHDLSVSYDLTDWLQVNFGVDNVFDKQPPNSIDFPGFQIDGQSGTDPSTYDILRRRYRFAIRIRR